MRRATWDETWASVADAVSLRSACAVRRVGCVIASADNRVHWVGYNGPPARLHPGLDDGDGASCGLWCPQGGGIGPACVSVHAEINALLQSDFSRRAGCVVYASQAPCWKCSLAIAASGAARLVTRPWEPIRASLAADVGDLMTDCGISLTTDWPRSAT